MGISLFPTVLLVDQCLAESSSNAVDCLLLFEDMCTLSFSSQYIQPFGLEESRYILHERSSRYHVLVARGLSIGKKELHLVNSVFSSFAQWRHPPPLPLRDNNSKKVGAVGCGRLWSRGDFRTD